MKNNNLMSVVWVGLFVFLFPILFLGGCAADKTPEEYHDQKADQAAAINEHAAGEFIGPLTTSTGETLGTIDIVISTENETTNDTDDTQTVETNVITGSVSLIGASNTMGTISTATYTPTNSDATQGSFAGTISVPDANGNMQQVTINGTINGDTFTGSCTAVGYDPINFTAIRGPSSNNQKIISNPVAGVKALNFDGTSTDPVCTAVDGTMKPPTGVANPPSAICNSDITMTIIEESSNPGANFYSIFSDLKPAEVQIQLTNEVDSDGLQLNQPYVFPDTSTTINSKSGTIDGLDSASDTLHCNAQGTGWTCELVVNGKPMPISFQPATSN